MRLLKTFAVLVLSVASIAAQADSSIITGQQYKLQSKVLTEERGYSVYLPPSYAREADKKYPTLVVLDGDNTRLRGISGLVESLSSYNLERQIPEFIIVAVPNTNRVRDLTPTETNLVFNGKTLAEFEISGGANTFIQFLEKELLPKINKEYRTNGRRALVGQSFGGLFTAHVLMTRPDLFSDYLVTDATYVWDNNYLNRVNLDPIKKQSKRKISAFFALANNDHIGEHGVANREWGNEFIAKLKENAGENLKVEHRYFPEERHGTVEMLSWYFGLLSLFKED